MLLSPFASTQANYQLDDDSVAMEATDGFYNASVWDRGMFPSLTSQLATGDMWVNDHFRLQNGGGVIVGTIDNHNNGYTVYDFDSVNITVHDDENLFVAKYDANNNFVWVETARKSTGEIVTADANGNVYISGYLKGNAPFGTTVLTSSSSGSHNEVYYAGLSSTGNWLWADVMSVTGNSQQSFYGNIEVDSNTNELYFCGNSYASTTLGAVTITSGAFLGKMYANNGTVIILKSLDSGSANLLSVSRCHMTLGANQEVIVGGTFSNDFTLDGVDINHLQGYDLLVLNFHSNLSLNWHYTLGSSGSHSFDYNAYLRGLDVDSYGNVYLAATVPNSQIGNFTQSWASANYGTIIRVNATSHQVDWVDWPGHTQTSSGYRYSTGDTYSVTVAPNGNIAITGQIESANDYTFGNITKYLDNGNTNSRTYYIGVLDANHEWIHIHSLSTYDTDSISGLEYDGNEIWLPWATDSGGYGLSSLVFDEDYDGIFSPFDNCIPSSQQWNSTYASDQDRDGCHDILEDDDDDGDGVLDIIDNCLSGRINWNSNAVYDRDGDGCADTAGVGFSQEIFPLSNYSNDDESMVTIVDFEPSPLGGAFVAGEFQDDAMLGDLLLESQCYEYRSGLCYTKTAPFVAKVDSNGVWEWAISITSSGGGIAKSISVDAYGDAYVVGDIDINAACQTCYNTRNVHFESLTKTTKIDSGDISFVTKVNQSGNFDWAQLIEPASTSTNGYFKTFDVSEDSGLVSITGVFYQNMELDWDTMYGVSGYNMFVAQLSASTGGLIWMNRGDCYVSSGQNNDCLGGINQRGSKVVQSSQEVYLITEADRFDGFSNVPNSDFKIAKLGSIGSWQWVKSVNTGSNNYRIEHVNSFIEISSGDLLVAGNAQYSGNYPCDTGWSSGLYCGFVQQYDSSGNFNWSTPTLDEGSEIHSIVESESGYVAIGTVVEDMSIGSSFVPAMNAALFLANISSSGQWISAEYLDGELFENSYRPVLNINSTGSMWMLGTFSSNYVSYGSGYLEGVDELRSMLIFEQEEEDFDDDGDQINDVYDNCYIDVGWISDALTDHDSDGCRDAGEDLDDDNDGINDAVDNCPTGVLAWSPSLGTDWDNDGCRDIDEDVDDDNDGVFDVDDVCPTGQVNWLSSEVTDHDTDGCRDTDEDSDDDNDGINDSIDYCATGEIGWTSSTATDHDGDGCQDESPEDIDDDNDGIADINDLCPSGATGWTSDSLTDTDSDGCQDASEDFDRDNDGIVDSLDLCPNGEKGWTSSSSNDMDSDGCRDSTEDDDDDGDGVADLQDSCPSGIIGWNSNSVTDYDLDGCQDSSEDNDDDSDNILDDSDQCPLGLTGWLSDFSNDHDSDGCIDASEDNDDDNDGVLDSDDYCPRGSLNWQSNQNTDRDGDGCRDSSEDLDDDNDGLPDGSDLCDKGETNWNSGTFTDYDSDGCKDDSEDLDDDNDGVQDESDICQTGQLDWQSDETTDHDADGCNDNNEDSDDDNDGLLDTNELCPKGSTGWTSNLTSDYDSDGCNDLSEDADDDNDAILDIDDSCKLGKTDWTSNPQLDLDGDGCFDASEDSDDDNDGVEDNIDICPKGDTNWLSTEDTDVDSDGCQDDTEDSSIDLSTGSGIKNEDGSLSLDAIGLIIAILFPAIGAVVTLIIRGKQKQLLRDLMASLSSETTLEGLEEVFSDIRGQYADEKISSEHFQRLLMEYDLLKSKLNPENSFVEKSFDQTELVLESEKSIPEIPVVEQQNTLPSVTTEATQVDGNGYEWYTTQDGTNYYRITGSQNEWIKFES